VSRPATFQQLRSYPLACLLPAAIGARWGVTPKAGPAIVADALLASAGAVAALLVAGYTVDGNIKARQPIICIGVEQHHHLGEGGIVAVARCQTRGSGGREAYRFEIANSIRTAGRLKNRSSGGKSPL
jgi:hypothetical protein